MAIETPITFTEATKIIGCMNMVLVDAIRSGKLITIRGDWSKIDPRSFRFFCAEEFGLQIDRLPEKRRRFRKAAPQAFSKKAMKKMKRKVKHRMAI
jgi:hypothetical protein